MGLTKSSPAWFAPALELQAIGRVHRLGQKREVEITRLIMKESIETRLLELLKKKYGDSTNIKKDDKKDSDSDSEEKKAPKKAAAVVGCVSTDRTKVVTEEFDLLFGAEPDPTKNEMKKEAKKEAVKTETLDRDASSNDDDDSMDSDFGMIWHACIRVWPTQKYTSTFPEIVGVDACLSIWNV